jgi:hypothetical protein
MKRTQWLLIVAVMWIAVATHCRNEQSVLATTETTATTHSATVTETSAETVQPVSDIETDPHILTAPPPMDAAAPAETPRYALEDAAARGLVEYEMHGTDMSSGDSLLLGIRRLSDSAIDVYIVPGTVFVSGNSEAQTMVGWGVVRGAIATDRMSPDDLQEVTSMYLPDLQPRVYVVEAYCLDFELENPARADAFKPRLAEPAQATAVAAAAPDFRAVELIREGKRRGLSISGIQVALWADHNHTKEEIATKFDAKAEEMDKAFEMVLNAPPPKKRQ